MIKKQEDQIKRQEERLAVLEDKLQKQKLSQQDLDFKEKQHDNQIASQEKKQK